MEKEYKSKSKKIALTLQITRRETKMVGMNQCVCVNYFRYVHNQTK